MNFSPHVIMTETPFSFQVWPLTLMRKIPEIWFNYLTKTCLGLSYKKYNKMLNNMMYIATGKETCMTIEPLLSTSLSALLSTLLSAFSQQEYQHYFQLWYQDHYEYSYQHYLLSILLSISSVILLTTLLSALLSTILSWSQKVLTKLLKTKAKSFFLDFLRKYFAEIWFFFEVVLTGLEQGPAQL